MRSAFSLTKSKNLAYFDRLSSFVSSKCCDILLNFAQSTKPRKANSPASSLEVPNVFSTIWLWMWVVDRSCLLRPLYTFFMSQYPIWVQTLLEVEKKRQGKQKRQFLVGHPHNQSFFVYHDVWNKRVIFCPVVFRCWSSFNYYLLLRLKVQFRKLFQLGYIILHSETWARSEKKYRCIIVTTDYSLLSLNSAATE